MPAVNPKYVCQPCSRGHHRWCTMEDTCMCKNAWDGDGFQDVQNRLAQKKRVAHLTTQPAKGLDVIPESGPLWAGRRIWFCEDCGFKSPYWKGCERFRYCTTCEDRHREIDRRRMAIEGKITRGRDDGMIDGGTKGGGQGAQASLPLSAHRDGRCTDSPCDKKEPSSA